MTELVTKILLHNAAAPKLDGRFHYCEYIGQINFLKKITLLDIE